MSIIEQSTKIKPNSKKEVRKASQASTIQRLSQLGLIAMFLIGRVETNTKYQIELYKTNHNHTPVFRKSVNELTFVAYQLKQQETQKIGFNLKSGYSPFISEKRFLQGFNMNNFHMYGSFLLGDQCYTHINANSFDKFPLFIFSLKHATGQEDGRCQVVGLITNSNIEKCQGGEADLWRTVLRLDRGDLSPPHNFRSFRINSDFLQNSFPHFRFRIMDLEFKDVTEELVEMMVLQPFYRFEETPSVSEFSYEVMRGINENLGFNPGLSGAFEVKAEEYIPRITHDDLPGFILGPTVVDEDLTSLIKRAVQKVVPRQKKGHFGVNFEFFIEKPDQIPDQKFLIIRLRIRDFAKSASDTLSDGRDDLNYMIRIKRNSISTNSGVTFEILRQDSLLRTLTYIPVVQTNFLYFSFTISEGILYYSAADKVVVRTYSYLAVHSPKSPIQRSFFSFDHELLFENFYAISKDRYSLRHLVVIYDIDSPSSVGAESVTGLRITGINYGEGVYPGFLVSKRDTESSYEACYLEGYGPKKCLNFVYLENAQDPHSLRFRRRGEEMNSVRDNDKIVPACRVILKDNFCLRPKTGYTVSLEMTMTNRLEEQYIQLGEYEAYDKLDKNFFFEYTNNVGTKYLINCPYSCETCGFDLKCLTCPELGVIPQADGLCPVSKCTSTDKHCVKCAGDQKCRWCGGKDQLQPLDDEKSECRRGGCLPGYGFKEHITSPVECVKCLSPRCKTCKYYEHCTGCQNPDQRLLYKNDEDRVPESLQFYGTQDCFSIEELKDYLYYESKKFLRCYTNCKRCTTKDDCQLCGDHRNKEEVFYLYKNPSACKSECNFEKGYYIWPEGGFNCLECGLDKRYLEGTTDPPQCVACDQTGQYTDPTNGWCRSCGTGCASCEPSKACTRCINSEHSIQSDGQTCRLGCGEKEFQKVDGNGVKSCAPCPPNCEECTLLDGCIRCEVSYFLDALKECEECLEGCSLCPSKEKCEECSQQSRSLYLSLDTKSCLTECPEGQYGHEGEKTCKECLTNCKSCDSQGCKVCEDGFFESSGSCKPCSEGCKKCTSESVCLECFDPFQVFTSDGSACTSGCRASEFKNVEKKRCEKCSEYCLSCTSGTICNECQSGSVLKKELSNGSQSCLKCPTECKECNSDLKCLSCSDPKVFYDEIEKVCLNDCGVGKYGDSKTKKCLSCSSNCLSCDSTGCLQCQEAFYLRSGLCREGEAVDYDIRQSYDPRSNATFSLKLTLDTQSNLTTETYKQFEINLLKSEDKFTLRIDQLPSGDGQNSTGFTYKVLKSTTSSLFHVRVYVKNTTLLKIGDQFSATFQSFKQLLDPTFTDPVNVYTLKPKTQQLELEVFRVNNKPLAPAVESVASISSSTSTVSSSASTGLGVGLMILSNDPSGVFIKFNQFLTLMGRIKMIGIFFGSSLERFIEQVSGGNPRAEDDEEAEKRVLEVSLTHNKDRIAAESNGAHNKLDQFQQTIFLEGMFLIKMVLYSISWAMKAIGLSLLAQMKAKSKVVKWKLNYLKYQRKVHFILVMSSVLDISYFGTRILLHRRNSSQGMVVKSYVGMMYTLMIVDLLEIGFLSTKLKFEEEIKQDSKKENHSFSDTKEKEDPFRVNFEENSHPLDENYESPSKERLKKNKGDFFRKYRRKNASKVWPKNRTNRANSQKNEVKSKLFKINKDNLFKQAKKSNLSDSRKALNRDDDDYSKFQLNNSIRNEKRLQKSENFSQEWFGLEEQKSEQIEEEKKEDSYRNDHFTKRSKNSNSELKSSGPKVHINLAKTLAYNSRNLEIEKFSRSLLIKDPRSFTSPLQLLNNFFGVLHIALMQVSIVALPHSPNLLLITLMIMELTFCLLTLVPYLLNFRFVSCIELLSKALKSFFLEAFFSVCLIISLSSGGTELPVNKSLQKLGVITISLGVITAYLFTIVKMVILVVGVVKGLVQKNKKKKEKTTGEEDLSLEMRGLFFYSDVDLEAMRAEEEAMKIDIYEEKEYVSKETSDKPGEGLNQHDDSQQLGLVKKGESNPFSFLDDDPREEDSDGEEEKVGPPQKEKNRPRMIEKGNLSWFNYYIKLIKNIEKKKEKERIGDSQNKNMRKKNNFRDGPPKRRRKNALQKAQKNKKSTKKTKTDRKRKI